MIGLVFYILDSQEIDRGHEPPLSEAIRGSGGIEYSYALTKSGKVSTLRLPDQMTDAQVTPCAFTQYRYTMPSS